MTITSRAELETALATEASANEIVTAHFPAVTTHSGLQMFQQCEMKWLFRYVLSLGKRRTQKHFVTGTLMHFGMETLLKHERGIGIDPLDPTPKTVADVLADLDGLMTKEIDKIAERSDMLGGSDSEMLEYCRVQALAMCRAWAVISLPKFANYEVIGVEHLIKLNGETGWSAFSGKIDGVLKNRKTGLVYMLEHKSRAQLGTLNTAMLSLDQQANWYMDAYEMMSGAKVDGFLYDVVQKPLHKMSAKGSDDLCERMTAAMLDDPDKYFAVVDVIADRGDRRANLRNMRLIYDRMRGLKPSAAVRNTAQCEPYGGGSGCPYKALCCGGIRGDTLCKLLKSPELSQFDIVAPNTELVEETVSE